MQPVDQVRDHKVPELKQGLGSQVQAGEQGETQLENYAVVPEGVQEAVPTVQVHWQQEELAVGSPHYDPPPDVEGVVPVVCQQVRVGHCVAVDEKGHQGAADGRKNPVPAKKYGKSGKFGPKSRVYF